MKTRILIVDDEPLAREGIRDLLAAYNDVDVVGEASDGAQAVEKIEAAEPDIVFLDIQMPELNGFGVVKQVGVEKMPTTIFVTAYDEFAVQAFEVHACDYLLKPIDAERFTEAFGRARSQLTLKNGNAAGEKLRQLLENLPSEKPSLQRLAIKSSGKITFINTSDIDWIQANGDYVWIYTQGKKSLLREKIGELSAKLDQRQFIRIHRSTIVQTDRIKDLEPMFYGDYAVNLFDGTKLTLSRSYRDAVFSVLHVKNSS